MMWVDTAKKYLGAFCAKDLDTMESLLSDNVSMTSWSCATTNKETTLQSHRNFFDFADNIKVRIDNVAYKNSFTCLELQMNYTINYENMQLEPRKMMFRKDDMIYLDTKEAFKYRQEFPMWDKRVLKHHPHGTEYFDTYGDMRWHSEFEWERGRMILFDTRRWHSSSWWTTSSDIIPNSPEYKESLTGFGSVDVPRN